MGRQTEWCRGEVSAVWTTQTGGETLQCCWPSGSVSPGAVPAVPAVPAVWADSYVLLTGRICQTLSGQYLGLISTLWPGMLPPPHWSRLACRPHLKSDWLAGRTLTPPIGQITRTVAAVVVVTGPGQAIIRLDICVVLIRNIRVV